MSFAILVMVMTVTITAVRLGPDVSELLRGFFVPTIPDIGNEGLVWTVALLGGVGGTVTLLCCGYWIREEGIEGSGQLRQCRLDLASGYFSPAIPGAAAMSHAVKRAMSGRGMLRLLRCRFLPSRIRKVHSME